MSHRRPNRIWPIPFVVLAAIALAPATSHAYPRSLRCEYVEAGPPGPAGNLLEIAGNDSAQVRRDGDLVLVGTSATNGPRQFEEIDCGTQATVTNLDRIVYRGEPVPGNVEHQFLLDGRGGSLAPGATPEAVDPEIEVEVILPAQREARPRVQLLAGDGRDGVRLHAVSGVTEVSLEPWPWPRGLIPDPDLTISAPPRKVELKVRGGGGGDVLDARGLDRHRSLVRSVLLTGDDGKDVLLGTLAGDVLEGGSGPDRLFGRDGRDFLYPSAGEDLVSGGPGADFITASRGSAERDSQPDTYYGGSGDDYISARVGGVDKIGCGPGFDEAQADRVDELVDGACEIVRGPAR
jgi:hypothetical protein